MMKNLHKPFVLALLAGSLAAAIPAAAADPSASAPAVMPAASAPPLKPEKRTATPEEMRDSATEPGDLRPESRVTPQINVPLNPAGTGKPAYVRPSSGKAAQSGGINDSAARCNAIEDAQARKDCLARLR